MRRFRITPIRAYAGETKYTLSTMLRFSLDAIESFSHRSAPASRRCWDSSSQRCVHVRSTSDVLRIGRSYLPCFSSVTLTHAAARRIHLIAIRDIGEDVGRSTTRSNGRPAVPRAIGLNVAEHETIRAAAGPARAGAARALVLYPLTAPRVRRTERARDGLDRL